MYSTSGKAEPWDSYKFLTVFLPGLGGFVCDQQVLEPKEKSLYSVTKLAIIFVEV